MGKVNRNSELLYLRLGDIVAYNGELVKVTSDISNLGVNLSNGAIDVPIYELDLVPITDEMLIKLGFKYHDILGYYFNGDGNIKYVISEQKLVISHKGLGLLYPNCVYLHEFGRCINLINDHDLFVDLVRLTHYELL